MIPQLIVKHLRSFWKEYLRPLAVLLVVMAPLRSSLADWNWVPTGSMKPTILEGDMVLVNKLAYDLKVPFTLNRLAEWADPKVGDIVVLFSPADEVRLVKRVVAGPGDTIAMRQNTLILNGKPLPYRLESAEPFAYDVHEDAAPIVARETLPGKREHWVMSLPSRAMPRSFPPITVPEGQYFVMGDSRDNSADSRAFGFVERRRIVGRAEAVLVSMDKNHHYLPRLGRWASGLE